MGSKNKTALFPTILYKIAFEENNGDREEASMPVKDMEHKRQNQSFEKRNPDLHVKFWTNLGQ